MAQKINCGEVLGLLSFLWVLPVFAAEPLAGGAASREALESPVEIIPLDPYTKKTPRKDTKFDFVEQKGIPANPPPDAKAEEKKIGAAQSRSEMCELFEGKVISFAGSMSFIEKCMQRTIEDPSLLNYLTIDRNVQIVDVPSVVVRTLPFGKAYEKPISRQARQQPEKAGCARIEANYLTADGETFYFVENCRKRKFEDYVDFIAHNYHNSPVFGLSSKELEAIPNGAMLRVKPKDESAILYKMDGEVFWSRLFLAGKVDRNEEDSLKKIEKMGNEKSAKVTRAELCSLFEGKIVSFYSRVFLVQKCLRRPVTGLTLEAQMSLYEKRSPVDITAEQYQAIPEGLSLAASDIPPIK